MQIVINIPQKWRKDMAREEFIHVDELCNAILQGVVLPEKHGRLIDADVLRRKWVFDRADKEEIDDAPTIIEADVESEEQA